MSVISHFSKTLHFFSFFSSSFSWMNIHPPFSFHLRLFLPSLSLFLFLLCVRFYFFLFFYFSGWIISRLEIYWIKRNMYKSLKMNKKKRKNCWVVVCRAKNSRACLVLLYVFLLHLLRILETVFFSSLMAPNISVSLSTCQYFKC